MLHPLDASERARANIGTGSVSDMISTGSASDLGLNIRWLLRENIERKLKALKHGVLVPGLESYCSLRPRSLTLPLLIGR